MRHISTKSATPFPPPPSRHPPALPPLGDRLGGEGGDPVKLGRVDELVDGLRDGGQELPATAAPVVVVVVVGDGGGGGQQTEQTDADQRHQQDRSDQTQTAPASAALLQGHRRRYSERRPCSVGYNNPARIYIIFWHNFYERSKTSDIKMSDASDLSDKVQTAR